MSFNAKLHVRVWDSDDLNEKFVRSLRRFHTHWYGTRRLSMNICVIFHGEHGECNNFVTTYAVRNNGSGIQREIMCDKVGLRWLGTRIHVHLLPHNQSYDIRCSAFSRESFWKLFSSARRKACLEKSNDNPHVCFFYYTTTKYYKGGSKHESNSKTSENLTRNSNDVVLKVLNLNLQICPLFSCSWQILPKAV